MLRPQHQEAGLVITCSDKSGDVELTLVLDFRDIYYLIYAPPLSGLVRKGSWILLTASSLKNRDQPRQRHYTGTVGPPPPARK